MARLQQVQRAAEASTDEVFCGGSSIGRCGARRVPIAQELLKREVLNYDDVRNLIGTPPHGEKHVVELVDNILPKDGA
ncbi:hypothetical protein OSTOST_03634 [Ostertagia ostertagi]